MTEENIFGKQRGRFIANQNMQPPEMIAFAAVASLNHFQRNAFIDKFNKHFDRNENDAKFRIIEVKK